jgi:hypothetical protein
MLRFSDRDVVSVTGFRLATQTVIASLHRRKAVGAAAHFLSVDTNEVNLPQVTIRVFF